MKVLDLFSGIGGFSLGLERAGFETVAFCEIDPFCRKVLKKHWPDVPIHEDITQLDGKQYESVDVVCGGFPCQPFSHAGKRAGEDDDRALWPGDATSYTGKLSPLSSLVRTLLGSKAWDSKTVYLTWKVTGSRSRCLIFRLVESVPSTDDIDYGLLPTPRSCSAMAATFTESTVSERRAGSNLEESYSEGNATDTSSQGLPGLRGTLRSKQEYTLNSQFDGRPTEPPVCRADDAIPNRVDRLRSLGNAVVPQIPELLGRAILEEISG